MKQEEDSIHIRYLMANEQDLLWGLTVNTVGFQHIVKNTSYPPSNHPTRYLFSTDKGRVLNEYQLIYTIRGRGTFTSTTQKQTEIKAGNMYLLFPGEWHSYKPDKETGWDEYWIGFSGSTIDNRVDNKFFSKQKPVFNVGIQDEIVRLYKQAIQVAREEHPGFQQMLAGIVNLLLGYACSYDRKLSFEELQVTNQINQAKILIDNKFHTGISPEEIACQVNMSYSWFRHIFKRYTGFAPNQYILELKIRKGKELLTNTMMTVKEITFEVGMDNPEYFCTLFRRKAGMTPMAYREFTQGNYL